MKEHHSKHHAEHETHHAEHGVHPGYRKMRNTGGVNEAEEDLKEKTESRTHNPKIDAEADERKHGGKTRRERKKGGGVRVHHVDHEGKLKEKRPERKSGGKLKSHVKEVHMHGELAKHHAGRAPRKAGGRTGADSHPFSSARHGTEAPGRKLEMDMED